MDPVNIQDPAVFNAIWNSHRSALYYIALGILGERAEAEDAATEAFVKLWNSGLRFDNEAAVRQWLKVTVRNVCINVLKQKNAQRERLKQFAAVDNDPDEPAYHHEELLAQLLDTIYREIEQLPEKSRAVFTLRYLRNLSNEEIARELGIKQQSLRDHLVRALSSSFM